MRGEYTSGTISVASSMELPPRARRILVYRNGGDWAGWNYLRVRGEYLASCSTPRDNRELPPRARRIPVGVGCDVGHGGTTSACAENTAVLPHASYSKRNYLRVRGEYSSSIAFLPSGAELPPRARRIPERDHLSDPTGGTTSACAENTGQTARSVSR